MVEGAEYLLFLGRSLQFDPDRPVYYDFYSQGKYNIDGTDLTAGSPAYDDVEAVRARYGDRIDFALRSPEKSSPSSEVEENAVEASWIKGSDEEPSPMASSWMKVSARRCVLLCCAKPSEQRVPPASSGRLTHRRVDSSVPLISF